MRVSASDRQLHDRMVLSQKQTYEKEGARVVAADLPGWPTPPKVGRHIPDIMAEFRGEVVYNEVETYETMTMPETKEQLEDFAAFATLHLTVPQLCFDTAMLLTARGGIKVEMFWQYGGEGGCD